MRLSDHASRKLTSFLAENDVIESSAKELYSYCFDFVLDILFFNLSVILIGCLLRKPLPALIYIITMTPMKMMAGGAHARSIEMCSVISYAVAIGSILLSSNIHLSVRNTEYELIVFFVCLISIIALAPVDTPNKRFDTLKRRRLKVCCLIYSMILAVLYMVFYIQNITVCYSIMTICVIIIAINQYIGICVNMLRQQ